MINTENLLNRFVEYTKVDTMSDPSQAGKKGPTTECQWDLIRLLEKQLKELGLETVVDKHANVVGTLKGNKKGIPTIGFSAHVDTASDVEGNHVKARVINNYDGKDVKLNHEHVLKVANNPELLEYKNGTIIVTDGNTLLGSDDKAGVAEIMAAIEYLVANPQIQHGDVEVLFSSDEETGGGLEYLDIDKLKGEAYYTLDGSQRYYIETECFNGASAYLTFKGVSYHFGDARGKLVNALTMASKFVTALPQIESPEGTDGRYGYYGPQKISGNSSEVKMEILLRDFDLEKLKKREETIRKLAETTEFLFPGGKVLVDIKYMYYNMAEAARQKPKAVEMLWKAGKELGQPLKEELIRGGTDGAKLAAKGIPCPNIYTGGHNLHGVYEWASLRAMEEATELVVEIIKQWAK